jgi:hypothetical protein
MKVIINRSGSTSTRQSIQDFIRAHRAELDVAILRACPNAGAIDDAERRLWILNDEGLYNWARSEGVIGI